MPILNQQRQTVFTYAYFANELRSKIQYKKKSPGSTVAMAKY